MFEQRTVIIEKGCIADSVYRFPDAMRFFSDGTALEFGGFPMAVQSTRPTRGEAIRYYRDVVLQAGIDVRQRETVLAIDGCQENFQVRTSRTTYTARRVIIATGFYGEPNLLNVPGESLPKVAHYYRDAHPYFGQDVAVVGGRNSAGIVASELADAGARVTLIHHRDRFGMKPWIAVELEAKIREGAVRAYMNCRVTSIRENSIALSSAADSWAIKNDFVFAMTGYRPDFDFLRRNGLPLLPCGTRPVFNPDTLESGRAGIYFAGTVMAGIYTHEISIETARHHGAKIAASALPEMTRSMSCSHSQVGEVRHYARTDP